jgi:hypothetical protein
MPYISKDKRFEIDVPWSPYPTPGELNFTFTQIIEQYRAHNGDSYSTYNDIIGALECAKLELYRRVVKEYENEKRKAHGDVYA